MNIIRFLVDNNIHAMASDKHCLRFIWDRLKQYPNNMTIEKKQERKKAYMEAIKAHHENRREYIAAMTGNFELLED